MQYISETQIKEFQTQLLNLLEKTRQSMSDILLRSNHISHNLAAKKLQKISTDDLLELALKIDLPSISHKVSKIKSIDAALNNVHIGMYGFCSDCEEPLTSNRLHEDPTIQRCSRCESKYKKQKNNNFKL